MTGATPGTGLGWRGAAVAPPLRILIVDDSAADREVLCRALLRGAPRHYHCDAVATATECIRTIREPAGEPIACLLLDYHLPDDDALGVLRTLGGPRAVPVPVVVVTGSADRRLGVAAIHAGAQDFISKEALNPESLTRAVDNAIERYVLLAERGRMEQALRES